jgi:hypothetical protein
VQASKREGTPRQWRWPSRQVAGTPFGNEHGAALAFTFKGKNIDTKEISKELSVRYVLEGSVQRDRNHMRVNAQLVDAETGAHHFCLVGRQEKREYSRHIGSHSGKLGITTEFAKIGSINEPGRKC